MEKIKIFLNFSFPKKLLYFETLFFLILARLLIYMIPFSTLARFLGKQMKESHGETKNIKEKKFLKELKKIIASISLHIPCLKKCLVQAVAVKLMLKTKKIDSTLYLGLAKNHAKLSAHAWLRSGDIIITGEKNRPDFKQIFSFS